MVIAVDLLADIDPSLSIALSLQQAEDIHHLSILEAVYSANTCMEELKREQEQLELRLCQLNESLSESDAQLSQHHDELTHLKEEKTVIEKLMYYLTLMLRLWTHYELGLRGCIMALET
ncbi:hypothetical protein Pyn_36112 [Prunus yedoensis var. nudiflora]|uniref:Uncharacterized protein n=1 Tax=Prunus yedoensis var. nudiflora TaxID=2094558 RepID=A0A314YED8_PRUYE|nr:hypothetical protein Pyn_36112 [Prunus yedoensis var. nudiflora]